MMDVKLKMQNSVQSYTRLGINWIYIKGLFWITIIKE